MVFGLTHIRRGLIGLCIILLGVLAFAISSVNAAKESIANRKISIVAFTPKQAEAAGVKSAFKDKDYQISVISEMHNFPVADGFVVYVDGYDESTAKSFYETMKLKPGIKKLGISKKGSEILINKRFPDKNKAVKCIEKLKKEVQFDFKVKENFKSNKKMGFKCVLASVPASDSEEVKDYLKKKKFVNISESENN
ncbi:hypothetical protein IJT10_07170 [bacterium]|nr:hypothetical protein [bacterium]